MTMKKTAEEKLSEVMHVLNKHGILARGMLPEQIDRVLGGNRVKLEACVEGRPKTNKVNEDDSESYQTADGEPTTLLDLCRTEPEWAANVIRTLKAQFQELGKKPEKRAIRRAPSMQFPASIVRYGEFVRWADVCQLLEALTSERNQLTRQVTILQAGATKSLEEIRVLKAQDPSSRYMLRSVYEAAENYLAAEGICSGANDPDSYCMDSSCVYCGLAQAVEAARVFFGGKRDVDLVCTEHGITPHRWWPSPDAGPGWRCSECGGLNFWCSPCGK